MLPKLGSTDLEREINEIRLWKSAFLFHMHLQFHPTFPHRFEGAGIVE